MSSVSSSDSPVIDPALVRRTPSTSSTPAATNAVKAPKPRVNHVSGAAKKNAEKEKGARETNWNEDDTVLLAQARGYARLNGPSKSHSSTILIVEIENRQAKDH